MRRPVCTLINPYQNLNIEFVGGFVVARKESQETSSHHLGIRTLAYHCVLPQVSILVDISRIFYHCHILIVLMVPSKGIVVHVLSLRMHIKPCHWNRAQLYLQPHA